MGKFNSFEEITSWQKATILNRKIYLITHTDAFRKDFDLARQIRRCSVSISSNIAEGFERNTDKEFIHFLYIAKGPAAEVRSQLYLALDLNYISQQTFDDLFAEVTEISRLLSGFIKYLNK
ncbi:MAG: four helix bundle protein [Bacteroidia bacterium]